MTQPEPKIRVTWDDSHTCTGNVIRLFNGIEFDPGEYTFNRDTLSKATGVPVDLILSNDGDALAAWRLKQLADQDGE